MLIPHLVLTDVPIRKVPAGEQLIGEGSHGTSAFVLQEGEVRIDIGGKQIIFISDRGAIFGEMAILLNRPRGATVTAVQDFELLRHRRPALVPPPGPGTFDDPAPAACAADRRDERIGHRAEPVVADLLNAAARRRSDRRVNRWVAVAGMLAVGFGLFGVFGVRTEPNLPPNPHAFLDQRSRCPTCHDLYRGEIDPHEFVVEIPPLCIECHAEDQLGRSHPIGVDPRRSGLVVSTPEALPLEDGKVSCGTCHQPHAVHLSREKCWPAQTPAFIMGEGTRDEIPYFKTYFLRLSSPVGFDVLCRACHADF